jgi:hypothetical protein
MVLFDRPLTACLLAMAGIPRQWVDGAQTGWPRLAHALRYLSFVPALWVGAWILDVLGRLLEGGLWKGRNVDAVRISPSWLFGAWYVARWVS